MARKSMLASEFVLRVGDGQTPEVFTSLCLITSKSLKKATEMESWQEPDCENPTNPAITYSQPKSISASLDGSGTFAKSLHKLFDDWWRGAKIKNIQIEYVGAQTGDIQFEEGPAFLTKFDIDGEWKTAMTANLSFQFDGLPQVTLKP